MYKCKYFKIYELVDEPTFKKYGEKAWSFFDEKALMLIDELRRIFGSCTINDWKFGGKYKNSGLRTPECTEGSPMSQHRFGRGFDLKFKNATPDFVRTSIKSDLEFWKNAGLSGLEENTPTWVHVDTRNVEPVQFFNP